MVKLPRLRHIRHVPLSRQESFQEAAHTPSGIQRRTRPWGKAYREQNRGHGSNGKQGAHSPKHDHAYLI